MFASSSWSGKSPNFRILVLLSHYVLVNYHLHFLGNCSAKAAQSEFKLHQDCLCFLQQKANQPVETQIHDIHFRDLFLAFFDVAPASVFSKFVFLTMRRFFGIFTTEQGNPVGGS